MSFAPPQFVPHQLAARGRPSGTLGLASAITLPFAKIGDGAKHPTSHQLDLALVTLSRDSVPSSSTVHPAILARPLLVSAEASVVCDSYAAFVAACEDRSTGHRESAGGGADSGEFVLDPQEALVFILDAVAAIPSAQKLVAPMPVARAFGAGPDSISATQDETDRLSEASRGPGIDALRATRALVRFGGRALLDDCGIETWTPDFATGQPQRFPAFDFASGERVCWPAEALLCRPAAWSPTSTVAFLAAHPELLARRSGRPSTNSRVALELAIHASTSRSLSNSVRYLFRAAGLEPRTFFTALVLHPHLVDALADAIDARGRQVEMVKNGAEVPEAYMEALAGFEALGTTISAQRRASTRASSGIPEHPPHGASLTFLHTAPVPHPQTGLADEDALAFLTQAFHLPEFASYLETLEKLQPKVEWQVPVRAGRALPCPREHATTLLTATVSRDGKEASTALRLWHAGDAPNSGAVRFVGVLDARTTTRIRDRSVHHRHDEEAHVPRAAAAACRRVLGVQPEEGRWDLIYPWVADDEYSFTSFTSGQAANEPPGGPDATE